MVSPSRILLVDGTNTLYRAFFAIPPLRAPDGTPTHAAYGFVNTLQKAIREEEPDCAIVVFDARGRSFRHALYAEYKAGRDAQPEDLSAQIPLVRELLEAHAIPVLEVPEVEADDVIATVVRRAPASARVAIVSTDKDLLQLVSERVTMLDGIRDRRFGPADVEERFGVPPAQLLDLRALVGDPSDNIPGVPGIGQKGAAKLIREWGDLDNLLAHREEVTGKRAREALIAHEEQARLSKRLATLRDDVPLDGDFPAWARREPDRARLRALFERLGFVRLLEGLSDETADAAASGAAASAAVEVEVIAELDALPALVRELGALPLLAVVGVIDGRGVGATPAGLAFARTGARAAFVPLGAGRGPALEEVVACLRPLFEGTGALGWVTRDAKRLQVAFGECGLDLAPPHLDIEIASQLVDYTGSHGTPALALQHLGRKVRSFEDLAGRGARAVPAAELPLPELAAWAGEEVCALRDLEAPLAKRLAEDGLLPLCEEIELPLCGVLARMERAGVRVDEEVLLRLSGEYEAQLRDLEARIHRLAGEPFNVGSPKQLQHVLFEVLELPVVKRTKTGYSTDEDVLEQLAAAHELPGLVLAYRRLAKLKNTYVDALPPLIHPQTGRIHPTFHPLGAATGRLSSANPNVQNIPIRSEEGIRIREAFVPAVDTRLVSADYSQVELRILAHYSDDESLVEAFRHGEDIHRRTAAEVAGIRPEDVSGEQRARAKAVNFGIIYGSTAFGLARQLGIASAEAQATIDAYFERYRGVRRFLDETVARAREQGFVTTLLGRRRYLPELGSRNRALRAAAERMAVNTVIQGTAADLIKKAMLEVDAALRAGGLRACLLLQVHDELVLEAPEAELPALESLLRERMEGVRPLHVPLVVEVGVGGNWREAHAA